jgi:hypothetical protein
MTDRKPLVLDDGHPAELPGPDTLYATNVLVSLLHIISQIKANTIKATSDTGVLELYGGDDILDAPVIYMYGKSHATKPNAIELLNGAGVVRLSINASGTVTIPGNTKLEGSLNIAPATGWANQYISAPTAGDKANIFLRSGSTNRWAIIKNNDAESGGNAGASLLIARYADDGSYIDSPITINRATGMVSLLGGVRLEDGQLLGKSNRTGALTLYSGGAYNTGAGIVMRGDTYASAPNTTDFVNGAYVVRMRIAADGKVGINTSSPQAQLDVGGDVKATEYGFGGMGLKPVYLNTLGGTETYSKVLILPGINDGGYRNFAAYLDLIASGSNSPGSNRASGRLNIVWKQAGTNFALLIEGTYTGNVYYAWSTEQKTYHIWLGHAGTFNRLAGTAFVYPQSLADTYSMGQLAQQADTTGLTAVTLGTGITKT